MASEQEERAKAEREARLAAALRVNLHRRKARAREAIEARPIDVPPPDAAGIS